MDRPFLLRLRIADDQRDAWVVALLVEVATGQGWTIDEDGPERPDAVALVASVGASVPAVHGPVFAVAVEAGTPRSPVVAEPPAHLPARFDLVLGEFKARRNQQVTRDAIERFLARVEDERAEGADLVAAVEGAGTGAPAVIAEHQALLAAVDRWLARTTLTPEAARAVHADRTILQAAIGAPEIDLVIVERAAGRLASTIGA